MFAEKEGGMNMGINPGWASSTDIVKYTQLSLEPKPDPADYASCNGSMLALTYGIIWNGTSVTTGKLHKLQYHKFITYI